MNNSDWRIGRSRYVHVWRIDIDTWAQVVYVHVWILVIDACSKVKKERRHSIGADNDESM